MLKLLNILLGLPPTSYKLLNLPEQKRTLQGIYTATAFAVRRG